MQRQRARAAEKQKLERDKETERPNDRERHRETERDRETEKHRETDKNIVLEIFFETYVQLKVKAKHNIEKLLFCE